jgi:hypothetical protein
MAGRKGGRQLTGGRVALLTVRPADVRHQKINVEFCRAAAAGFRGRIRARQPRLRVRGAAARPRLQAQTFAVQFLSRPSSSACRPLRIDRRLFRMTPLASYRRTTTTVRERMSTCLHNWARRQPFTWMMLEFGRLWRARSRARRMSSYGRNPKWRELPHPIFFIRGSESSSSKRRSGEDVAIKGAPSGSMSCRMNVPAFVCPAMRWLYPSVTEAKARLFGGIVWASGRSRALQASRVPRYASASRFVLCSAPPEKRAKGATCLSFIARLEGPLDVMVGLMRLHRRPASAAVNCRRYQLAFLRHTARNNLL